MKMLLFHFQVDILKTVSITKDNNIKKKIKTMPIHKNPTPVLQHPIAKTLENIEIKKNSYNFVFEVLTSKT